MDANVTRLSTTRFELRDAAGRVIGTIVRPVEEQPIGPGREKVYLARRAPRLEVRDRSSNAA